MKKFSDVLHLLSLLEILVLDLLYSLYVLIPKSVQLLHCHLVFVLVCLASERFLCVHVFRRRVPVLVAGHDLRVYVFFSDALL